MRISEWEFPDHLSYDRNHQWVCFDGGRCEVGLTDFGQEMRGDILYLQLPQVGQTVDAGEAVGSMETGKWVGRIYAPCAGVVAEVNTALADAPEEVNGSPYQCGWLFRLSLAAPNPAGLLTGAAYRRWVEGEIDSYLQDEAPEG